MLCCVVTRAVLCRAALRQVADFVDRAVNISVGLKKQYPKLKEFREALAKEVRAGQLGSGRVLKEEGQGQGRGRPCS